MKVVRIDPSVAIVTRPRSSDDVSGLVALVGECLARQPDRDATAAGGMESYSGPQFAPVGISEPHPSD